MFFNKEREKHKLNISKPALLIIDIQRYFCDDVSTAYLPGVKAIFPQIEKLAKVFLDRSKPVIATVHVGGDKMMKNWWNNTVSKEYAEFNLKVKPTYLLYKNTYDAFHNTELQEILLKENIDQLVITGVMTHLCVETTARSAFVKGFEVIVVEDCTWDKEDWYHFASLKNLAHGFATICKAEELICMLE